MILLSVKYRFQESGEGKTFPTLGTRKTRALSRAHGEKNSEISYEFEMIGNETYSRDFRRRYNPPVYPKQIPSQRWAVAESLLQANFVG